MIVNLCIFIIFAKPVVCDEGNELLPIQIWKKAVDLFDRPNISDPRDISISARGIFFFILIYQYDEYMDAYS